ncbi:MAG: Glu/Leu/Phe/Val dehydrogenase [Candidatus Sericytochromatia bacterium]|nr:Glu/Leu/Phe/Val dehydrogenase [Candidatus Sericytochromatia bacterium]
MRHRLMAGCARLGLGAGFEAWMFAPDRVVQTYSPVRLDNGEVGVFPGYRVEHSNVMGPYYGGVRFHPEVDLDVITALAILGSWQAALFGVPFGGAKGGITVDPHTLSDGELERLTRRFTSDMVTVFDPLKDIPRPDVSTSEREMSWMMDTLSVNRGYAIPAAVTGKPLAIGGSQLAGEAAGRGVWLALREYERTHGLTIRGSRVVIEGFGKLGRTLAHQLYRDGARVVGVSDRSGGVWQPEGLDIQGLLTHVHTQQQVAGFPGAEPVSEADLLLRPCDVLIPASLSSQITRSNADRVQARLVVEGANMPVTPEADRLLAERGVAVLPDLVANAGGLVVGYFEWVQDNNQLLWTEEEVTARLRSLMNRVWSQVVSRGERDRLSLREAAHAIALERFAEAARLRGFYP